MSRVEQFLLFLLLIIIVNGSSIVLAQTAPDDKSHLELMKVLSEEARQHRNYLEQLNQRIFTFFSVIGAIIFVVIGFFNFRVYQEAKEHTVKVVDQVVSKRLDEKLRQVEKDLEAKAAKVDQKVMAINQKIENFDSTISESFSAFADTDKIGGDNQHEDDRIQHTARFLESVNVTWMDDRLARTSIIRQTLERYVSNVDYQMLDDFSESHVDSTNGKTVFILDLRAISDSQSSESNDDQFRERLIKIKEKLGPIPFIVFSPPKIINTYGKISVEAGAKYAVSTLAGIIESLGRIFEEPN